MSIKDNRCISYIYNEMDPSERLEFERDLQNNENLLIEVESLKKVSDQLTNPQLMAPPKNILDRIHKHAKQKAEVKKSGSLRIFWSSAAAILIVSAFGMTYLFDNTPGASDTAESTAGGSSWTINDGANENVLPLPVSNRGDSKSPWVDKNDVIHFQDRFNSTNVAQIDSVLNTNFHKLTPVTVPSRVSNIQQQLHLTGSNR